MSGYTKIKQIGFILVYFCIFLSSCAHLNSYNIYYRAMEYYRRATEGETPNIALLNETIERCARILAFFPDSRWADDAVMLVGKSFYKKGDTAQAELKFNELIRFYPESRFVPEAEVMLGKITLTRGDEIEAAKWFKRASREQKIKEEVDYWLTAAYFSSGSYENALRQGLSYLDSFDDGKFRQEVLKIVGEASNSLGKYQDALNYYEMAISEGGDQFDLSMRMANIHLLMGDIEKAKNIYDLIEPGNKEEENILKKRIAFCYELEGDLESAISTLLEVDTQESLFRIAMIHQKEMNLEKALEAYNSAKEYGPTSEIGKKATKKASALQEIVEIQVILGMRDTLETTCVDTMDQGGDTLPAPQPPTVEELVSARMRLAEIWLLEFENVDEAIKEYTTVIEEFPETGYRPRALYAIAWIEENIKGDLKSALAKYIEIEKAYPDTDYAVAARRQREGIEGRVESSE